MVTECLYCTNQKNFCCDYCGDPICSEHAKYDIKNSNVFCGYQCAKRWKRFGGGSKRK